MQSKKPTLTCGGLCANGDDFEMLDAFRYPMVNKSSSISVVMKCLNKQQALTTFVNCIPAQSEQFTRVGLRVRASSRRGGL